MESYDDSTLQKYLYERHRRGEQGLVDYTDLTVKISEELKTKIISLAPDENSIIDLKYLSGNYFYMIVENWRCI